MALALPLEYGNYPVYMLGPNETIRMARRIINRDTLILNIGSELNSMREVLQRLLPNASLV